jgi:hypothetical protein
MTTGSEDRILKLCNELIAAEGQAGFSALAAELRTALTEHIDHVRARLVEYPISPDRRLS